MAGADMSAARPEELVQEQGEAEEKQAEDKRMKKREQVLKKPKKTNKTNQGDCEKEGCWQLQPAPPAASPTHPHIHQLPDEVLAKIFGLLSFKRIVKVLSVCRRWQDVIEDRNIIKKLMLEDGKVTTEEVLSLIRSAQGLKSLELVERSDTVALLNAASARCTNLLQLSVVCPYASSSALTGALRKVFRTSPHITNLQLWDTSTSKSLRFYQELGGLLPDLRKLEFGFNKLSDRQKDALIEGCSRIQMEEFKAPINPLSEKHIAKLVQFWGRSLRALELDASKLTDGALALLAGCSELRCLKLDGLNSPGDCLRHLAALSHLEELYVYDKTKVEQENWCRFFSQSKSSYILRKLSLLGRYGVDDSVLSSVAASCPELEELQVYGRKVTVCGVREVLRCCCKLYDLYIPYVDARVAQIVARLPQLAPQLHRICIGIHGKDALDEATLSCVQAQMPHLIIE